MGCVTTVWVVSQSSVWVVSQPCGSCHNCVGRVTAVWFASQLCDSCHSCQAQTHTAVSVRCVVVDQAHEAAGARERRVAPGPGDGGAGAHLVPTTADGGTGETTQCHRTQRKTNNTVPPHTT